MSEYTQPLFLIINTLTCKLREDTIQCHEGLISKNIIKHINLKMLNVEYNRLHILNMLKALRGVSDVM